MGINHPSRSYRKFTRPYFDVRKYVDVNLYRKSFHVGPTELPNLKFAKKSKVSLFASPSRNANNYGPNCINTTLT